MDDGAGITDFAGVGGCSPFGKFLLKTIVI